MGVKAEELARQVKIKEQAQFLPVLFLDGGVVPDGVIGVFSWRRVAVVGEPHLESLEWMPNKSQEELIVTLGKLKSMMWKPDVVVVALSPSPPFLLGRDHFKLISRLRF